MTRNTKRMGWGGLTAAVALTASGLLAPTVAFAGDDPSIAPTAGADFDATAQRLLSGDDDIQAVAKDGRGNVVVYTAGDESDLGGAARSFVDSKSNVIVKSIGSPIEALAANDVVGGAGYVSPDPGDPQKGFFCSIGFAGWSPEGAPAVISAGHCTKDGTANESLLTTHRMSLPVGAANRGRSLPWAPWGTRSTGGLETRQALKEIPPPWTFLPSM